jgi:hydroxymethylglutaryl-CoA lyase
MIRRFSSTAATAATRFQPGDKIRIVEVGPRDGLQNEKTIVPASIKLSLIRQLAHSGLKDIEATSFVSPKWVPQFSDAGEVMASIGKDADGWYNPRGPVNYSVLTPNLRGYTDARKLGAKEVAIFGAASESFSRRNINCSIDESLSRFNEVMTAAEKDNVRVRGYV